MGKNAIVGQSGGPTSVINASLAGVFESCKSRGADIVYGMCNGVAGLLEERVVDLSTVLTDDLDIELLKRTPSSFLGSCRYKLPDWHEDEAVYKKLFAILEKLNIGYFFYIGGNDSMDTIGKLADYGARIDSDIRFMGVPKTIDNDLMVTDHTPGYGSAAKYIGVVMKEIIRDDTYVLRLSSETTGLAWLLKSVRIDMESRGRLTAAGLQPEHFSVRRNQAENTEQVAFDWAQKLVHVGNSPPQALDDGAQDLLSFNFHLGFMPQASVSGTLPIATSKKYGRYRLEIVGDETIETPAGTMNTLHLRAPGANTTELWLAYDYLLLPVRIRHEDRKGNAMVQTATSIRLGAVPDETAP